MTPELKNDLKEYAFFIVIAVMGAIVALAGLFDLFKCYRLSNNGVKVEYSLVRKIETRDDDDNVKHYRIIDYEFNGKEYRGVTISDDGDFIVDKDLPMIRGTSGDITGFNRYVGFFMILGGLLFCIFGSRILYTHVYMKYKTEDTEEEYFE